MENNMHHFLFGPKNNSFNKKIYSISSPAKHSSVDEIRSRFDQILTNDIFQRILPYLHFSREELFKKILPQLQALSTKTKLSNIDLLDLTFIINEPLFTEFILELKKSSLSRDVLDKAVLCDNTNALTLLEKKGFPVDVRLMRFAAEYGCLESLKYCVVKGLLPNYDALNDAALHGHIQIIKYLVIERNIMPDGNTLQTSITGSRLAPHGNTEAIYFIENILAQERDKQNNRVVQ